MTVTKEKLVIVGGGPAGLAAAIYASRARLQPLVFAGSPPGGQLTLTSEVENYPGVSSILGADLIGRMRHQALSFNARIIDANVIRLNLSKRPFIVELVDGNNSVFTGTGSNLSSTFIQTSAIIIATGARALWLGLDTEQRLRGKGVSACATCDGFFFRDKVVGVVGGGDTAMEEALTLSKFASKIYLIHRRDSFRASRVMQERVLNNPKIEIRYNHTIVDVIGQEKVNGVILQSTQDGSRKELKLDGLFVAIGHRPDTDLVKGQLMLDKKGYIYTFSRLAEDYLRGMVEPDKQTLLNFTKIEGHYNTITSCEGVFAAGDCVDYLYRQAATAAGMGVAAALDVERWLGQQT